MPVSRFAAYYPSGLAKRIARCIVKSHHTLVGCIVLHIEEISEADPRPKKKARVHEPLDNPSTEVQPEEVTGNEDSTKASAAKVKKGTVKARISKEEPIGNSEHPWAPVFTKMRGRLRRVGSKEFKAGDPEYNMILPLRSDIFYRLKHARGSNSSHPRIQRQYATYSGPEKVRSQDSGSGS